MPRASHPQRSLIVETAAAQAVAIAPSSNRSSRANCCRPTSAAIDGTGNNLLHPDWGSTAEALLRLAPAAYADGSPRRRAARRPSRPRDQQRRRRRTATTRCRQCATSPRSRYLWGQFIDHDLDLTNSASPAEPFNVAVPTGDPYFDPNGTGTQVIPLNRSNYDRRHRRTATRGSRSTTSPRSSTARWSTAPTRPRAAALRTLQSAAGSRPAPATCCRSTPPACPTPRRPPVPADQLFLAGDVRANENIELTALQTLFVREHNRLADQIAAQNPDLERRADLPAGPAARDRARSRRSRTTSSCPPCSAAARSRPYAGYNPNVNPGIANEFSTAAFRLGHSMLGDDVEFLDNDGNEVRDELDAGRGVLQPAGGRRRPASIRS